MFLTLRSLPVSTRGGALFAAGLAAGMVLVPADSGRPLAAAPASAAVTTVVGRSIGQPAEVLRVIDGDTFEARVRIWPGMDVTTRVRLRGIDAPELHARCAEERSRALDAREALARILVQGAVGVFHVSHDKYGGRVDADVSTAEVADVSAAMLAGGYARAYGGGRRQSWCG